MIIRPYKPSDYEQLKKLYLDSSTFGGQFDKARDAAYRLQKKIEADPDAILIAELDNRIVGTVSVIDDGRVAWLFRFAVEKDQAKVLKALHDKAIETLKNRGHSQVLVYTPVANADLNNRYELLGFTKGDDYTCYWKEI
jgi:predicted N-acetyltransferase YhbS